MADFILEEYFESIDVLKIPQKSQYGMFTDDRHWNIVMFILSRRT